MISDTERYILSYYRACELAGARLFAKLAFVTEIDDIRTPLTHHCLEEAEHAWLWTKTLRDLGATPEKVTQTYQTEYGKEYGMPSTALEILCLTQVFERRTLKHFKEHRDMEDVHPRVREALQEMIEDEEGHLSWVRERLDEYEDQEEIESTMEEFLEVDENVYKRLREQEPFNSYFGAYNG